ncbi:Transmembrane protein 252 [Liparis tanakae]|uniref:Transmembrane protein 252 n=1 Tax=Liparis tanakae TaxID=230148 RepID=A0A4Z2GXN5_9TELE|nr:Transmembrane protein 252 [Liparis tanakae]
MNVRKQLWSLLRKVLPAVGFVLTCLGVYLVSQQTKEDRYTVRVVFADFTLVFGILVVLIGFFWSVCHSTKSKVDRRGGHERHLQVYTVDRLSSFPPSYEESQGSRLEVVDDGVDGVDGVEAAAGLAPPLYSRDSSDAPDCTWSCERPPRYSQVGRVEAGRLEAGRLEAGRLEAEQRRGALPGH